MKSLLFLLFEVSIIFGSLLKPYSVDGKRLELAIIMLEKEKFHKNSLVVGEKKYFYETGELYLKYIKTSTNKVIVKKYYKSGQISLICPYVNAKKHGVAELYYKNGKLAATLNYSHNKMDGRYDEYRENGKLHFQKNFTNDILEIPVIKYDLQGNKKYLLDDENSKEVCY